MVSITDKNRRHPRESTTPYWPRMRRDFRTPTCGLFVHEDHVGERGESLVWPCALALTHTLRQIPCCQAFEIPEGMGQCVRRGSEMYIKMRLPRGFRASILSGHIVGCQPFVHGSQPETLPVMLRKYIPNGFNLLVVLFVALGSTACSYGMAIIGSVTQ